MGVLINRPCNDTLNWINHDLTNSHLQVMQTFDLHTARLGTEDCPCPNHGTNDCDCQMTVLLVYGKAVEPATLVLHGNDDQTWLSLVDTSMQHVNSIVQALIEQALQIKFSE